MAATHVGLPSMQASLGISVTASQWILNLTLMFLAGIVTVGGAWTRLRSRIPFGREKSPKMPKNPASQVHPIRMADHPGSRKKPSSGIATTKYTPNRQGGERRLNVAITRARIAVKLIASFEPEDIDLARTDSCGARSLRSYMKTARDGILAVFEGEFGNPDAEFDSPFEEAVFNALTHHGIKLVKQVGVSKYKIDFGVVDPEKPSRYLLGIECDGATYHSSPTARDRDRLRQQILEEKYCWKIHRIWSRDWINDSKGEINKVRTYAVEPRVIVG